MQHILLHFNNYPTKPLFHKEIRHDWFKHLAFVGLSCYKSQVVFRTKPKGASVQGREISFLYTTKEKQRGASVHPTAFLPIMHLARVIWQERPPSSSCLSEVMWLISCQSGFSFSLESAFTCRKYEASLMPYTLFWASTLHSHWNGFIQKCDGACLEWNPSDLWYLLLTTLSTFELYSLKLAFFHFLKWGCILGPWPNSTTF